MYISYLFLRYLTTSINIRPTFSRRCCLTVALITHVFDREPNRQQPGTVILSTEQDGCTTFIDQKSVNIRRLACFLFCFSNCLHMY